MSIFFPKHVPQFVGQALPLVGPPALPTIQVSLITGRAVRGALAERTVDGIVLKRAQIADEDAAGHLQWKSADGETFIPWAQVEYWQQGLDAEILAVR